MSREAGASLTAFTDSAAFREAVVALRSPITRSNVLAASGLARQDAERTIMNEAIAECARSLEEGEQVAARVATYRAPAPRKEAATRTLLPGLAAAADAHGIGVSCALSLALAYASCAE